MWCYRTKKIFSKGARRRSNKKQAYTKSAQHKTKIKWLLWGIGSGVILSLIALIIINTKLHVEIRKLFDQATLHTKHNLKKLERPSKKPAEKPPAKKAIEPKFEFYNELQAAENKLNNKQTDDNNSASFLKKTNNAQIILLQVAACHTYTEADGLKAKLALYGYESNIEQANLEGKSWYRVLIGPLKEGEHINKQKELAKLLHTKDILIVKR